MMITKKNKKIEILQQKESHARERDDWPGKCDPQK